jgi:uncharacterized phage-associated protein/DNA-binding transcriptional regulator YiaG
MKSPFTGGDTLLKTEIRQLEFRKEAFDIVYHFYECVDSKEAFTTAELDTLNITQVHNLYRAKYGIPFIEEIKNIREKYGLSAVKMSEVLGLGTNVYRQYESGEMPSVATGRLIRLSEDPEEFGKLLEMSRQVLEPHEFEKVSHKLALAKSNFPKSDDEWMRLLLKRPYPNKYNGFRVPMMEKISKMVQFFAFRNRPFTTALNKLLFYSDFAHFKIHGQGISGMSYRAIQKGPVPENYGGLYNMVVNSGYAQIEEADFGDFVGERFVANQDADMSVFAPDELNTLHKVAARFQGLSTKQIVHVSHLEPAWKENADEYNCISFEYGFQLQGLD